MMSMMEVNFFKHFSEILIMAIKAIKVAFHPGKKMPAIEIAGLCLPLKPQKERRYCMKQEFSVPSKLHTKNLQFVSILN